MNINGICWARHYLIFSTLILEVF